VASSKAAESAGGPRRPFVGEEETVEPPKTPGTASESSAVSLVLELLSHVLTMESPHNCVSEREREREREKENQNEREREEECVCVLVRACACACVRACIHTWISVETVHTRSLTTF